MIFATPGEILLPCTRQDPTWRSSAPGRERPEDSPTFKVRYRPTHTAFYTFADDEVLIQRVLHGSMDPLRHV
ncbi:hypothetical protein Pla86_53040 (plasmid) [Planctomycetes bacterium Pla86]|uniref:Uncharacterized protein n=1 Tax=Engelhardtia mirabilis TaxID=2528011 RepID=A0A518BT81_9BACT|nr:hypothetical protein Pla133_53020 [Planctomycetes bacterium Pla133]QDV04508.1 hypothetical protein Pla86_53040 [Planctomycetes bacterium Pla86]